MPHVLRVYVAPAVLLGGLAGGAAAVHVQQTTMRIAPAVTPAARPLPLTAVRLTAGPLKRAQDLDAAYLLALNPGWTPDQVKGALMVSAQDVPAAVPWSLGVGELDADAAATVSAPPNPNAALAPFVVPDPALVDAVFEP